MKELNTPLQRHKKFCFTKATHKKKTTELHNELKQTENELKMNLC